jgi:hypothetical protein
MATAAELIPSARDSVKSRHIGRGQVRNADLGRNAVTSAKVKDRTLLAADFAAGQLPAGPQGPAGTQGPAGPQGPQGAPGSDTQFNGAAAAGDLAGMYPNPTIASDAVGSAEVDDNSLRLRDTAERSGSTQINPPAIAANSCQDFSFAVSGTDTGDTTYLRPSANLSDGLIVSALSNNANTFVYRICNVTNAVLDSPAGSWRYIDWGTG